MGIVIDFFFHRTGENASLRRPVSCAAFGSALSACMHSWWLLLKGCMGAPQRASVAVFSGPQKGSIIPETRHTELHSYAVA